MEHRTGYEKIRALAIAVEAYHLRPSKKTLKDFEDARDAYVNRIHRPRHLKSKTKSKKAK